MAKTSMSHYLSPKLRAKDCQTSRTRRIHSDGRTTRRMFSIPRSASFRRQSRETRRILRFTTTWVWPMKKTTILEWPRRNSRKRFRSVLTTARQTKSENFSPNSNSEVQSIDTTLLHPRAGSYHAQPAHRSLGIPDLAFLLCSCAIMPPGYNHQFARYEASYHDQVRRRPSSNRMFGS